MGIIDRPPGPNLLLGIKFQNCFAIASVAPEAVFGVNCEAGIVPDDVSATKYWGGGIDQLTSHDGHHTGVNMPF